jgi:hypothetical protein
VKRPSFQFYPADHTSNVNVRRCTWAAKGAWLEVLCLLHGADEYGVLRWPLQEIAQVVGAPIDLLHELAQKGVLKGSDGPHDAFTFAPYHARKLGPPVTLVAAGDGPCWYSSRMVRDELVRQRKGESSRFVAHGAGSSPEASPDKSPKGGIGERQGDGSPSPSPSPSAIGGQPKQSDRDQAPTAGAVATTRGSRLSKEWLLPKAWGDWALKKYPQWTPDKVRDEATKFRNHWTSKSGKGATKLDWYSTWQNWCMDSLAHRDDPRPGHNQPCGSATPDAEATQRMLASNELTPDEVRAAALRRRQQTSPPEARSTS